MLQELKELISDFVGKHNLRDLTASLKTQSAKDALSAIASSASIDDYGIKTLAAELNSEILKNIGVDSSAVNAFLRLRNKAGVKPSNVPVSSATQAKLAVAEAREIAALNNLSDSVYAGRISVPEGLDEAIVELIEAETDKEETYRVTNDHHDIRINVKAKSPRHAREKAAEQDKRFEHRDTQAEKSWTKESVDEAVVFDDNQIAALKSRYNALEKMDPSSLPQIHALFDSVSPEALAQLAKSQIKFISPLAVNHQNRKSMKKESVDETAHDFIQQQLANRDINVKRVQKHADGHHQLVVDKDDMTQASATVRHHGLDKDYSVVGE